MKNLTHTVLIRVNIIHCAFSFVAAIALWRQTRILFSMRDRSSSEECIYLVDFGPLGIFRLQIVQLSKELVASFLPGNLLRGWGSISTKMVISRKSNAEEGTSAVSLFRRPSKWKLKIQLRVLRCDRKIQVVARGVEENSKVCFWTQVQMPRPHV